MMNTKKSKNLVLGASGMLGNAVLRYFSEVNNFESVGTIRSRTSLEQFPESMRSNLIPGIDVENLDGLINQSDVKPYLKSMGIAEERLIFTPNKFPPVMLRNDFKNNLSTDPLYVGLIGTDSSKKNYEELFASHLKADLKIEVKYFIYGHKTHYYDQLIHQFPSLKIELIESEKFDLDTFFSLIGPIVSVASNEGFGRPIASALLAGRPCYLLDQPVFREFYSSAAILCRSVPSLFENLMSIDIRDLKLTEPYTPPQGIVAAFNSANKFLEVHGI